MSDEIPVWRARCCANCGNVDSDMHYKDAVICNKSNKIRLNHECCDLFMMNKKGR